MMPQKQTVARQGAGCGGENEVVDHVYNVPHSPKKGGVKMDEKLFPHDLVTYLKGGKQLKYDADECEPGQIILLPFDELMLGEVYIDSEESPIAENDPHAGEEGYYSVPAVNLVADCEGYDPEGILIWLPD